METNPRTFKRPDCLLAQLYAEGYNLACILTFPQFQRRGYGKFLISMSYELTKREGTTGSPEKPLSDLGKISFRSYWAHVILNALKTLLFDESLAPEERTNATMQQIETMTGIKMEDILSTMHSLNLLKYWKGQYVISITQEIIDTYLVAGPNKTLRLCDPNFLKWEPSAERQAFVKESGRRDRDSGRDRSSGSEKKIKSKPPKKS
jgi:hypothetical protein